MQNRELTYKVVGNKPHYLTIKTPGNPPLRLNADGTTMVLTGDTWNQVETTPDPWLLTRLRLWVWVLNSSWKFLLWAGAIASGVYIGIFLGAAESPRVQEWLENRLFDLGLFLMRLAYGFILVLVIAAAVWLFRTLQMDYEAKQNNPDLQALPASLSRCSGDNLAILIANERPGDDAQVLRRLETVLSQINPAQLVFVILYRKPQVLVYNSSRMLAFEAFARNNFPQDIRDVDDEGLLPCEITDYTFETWGNYDYYLFRVWTVLCAYATSTAHGNGSFQNAKLMLTAKPVVFSSPAAAPVQTSAPIEAVQEISSPATAPVEIPL